MEIGKAGLVAAGVAAAVWIARRGSARLLLSRAKHRSLAGHPRWARRIARLVPAVSYDEARFFAADEAPAEVVERRRAAFVSLQQVYRERFGRTAAASAELASHVADVDFTSRYRVPFQFSSYLREQLPTG